jgi:hypothetical protein
MDMQEYIDNACAAARQKTLADSDQLTLGEIILKLEPIVKDQEIIISNDNQTEEALVVYDFEYLFPTMIDSWRGSYSELALNFSCYEDSKPMTVSEFLELLKKTVGKEFTGYKGGEYIMSKHTPIWVAQCGNSGNTAVVEIVDNGYEVVLITGYREF